MTVCWTTGYHYNGPHVGKYTSWSCLCSTIKEALYVIELKDPSWQPKLQSDQNIDNAWCIFIIPVDSNN